jgi:hypothetical protein
METKREQEKFVNSFNPAGMFTEGLISMGQGNIGEGLTEIAFSSPLLPKVLSKTGRQELKQGFNKEISNTVQPVKSSLKNKIKNFNYFLNEASGELIKGKTNKKAIEQGNTWLKNWIEHPNTQFKIDADLNAALPTYSTELIRAQSKNYTPNVKEYPLTKQISNPIHEGNYGVSYTHSHSPEIREMVQKTNEVPYSEYGEWMSRSLDIPQNKRISTTIHEGTHGWTSNQALEESGIKQQILDMYDPNTLEKYKTWNKLRNEGKNPKDFMKQSDAYTGYLANPTEVHARIMELRHQLKLSPDNVIEPEYAKKIMDWVKKGGSSIDAGFLDVIDNDPKKLANLFNNLWATTPAIGAGYLGSKLYQNQQKEKPVNKQFVSFKTGGKKCYTCNSSKMKVLYNKANYKK